jgi:hypothetical protein
VEKMDKFDPNTAVYSDKVIKKLFSRKSSIFKHKIGQKSKKNSHRKIAPS